MSRPHSSVLTLQSSPTLAGDDEIPQWETLTRRSGPVQVGAWLGGVALSGLIFLGIYLAQRLDVAEPSVETYELRSVQLPPPPPPPEVPTQRPPPDLVELVPVPTHSAIRLEMPIEPVPVPQLSAPPVVRFQAQDFRPQSQLQEIDFGRLFLVSEVDRAPVPIYRKEPRVVQSQLYRIRNPTVTLTFIVNARGEVENLEIRHAETPEYGRLVAEAVMDWRFEPAVKAGRRVRCFVLQTVTVHPPGAAGTRLHIEE